MAPRRKTRSMTNSAAKPAKALRKKSIRDDPNIEEWVYRFLGNLAAIERDKEATKKRNARSKTDQSRSSRAARLRLRSPTPYAWSPMGHNPVDDSDDMDDMDDDDALVTPMSQARNRLSKALSMDGPRIVHRDPTLLQKINRYIRAGIAEGKRRAKRYVRKALSFAIETGYVFPADREGKLLRVSPALLAAGKPLVDAGGARSRRSRPRPHHQRRQRSGRAGRVARRRRASSARRKRTAVRARRRRTNGEAAKPTTAGGAGDGAPGGAEGRNDAVKRKAGSDAPTEQLDNRQQRVGSRKSSGRPSSTCSSPSRRSHQRPIEDLAPLPASMIPSRSGSSEADRKSLSARSRPSSFARRSHDADDLLA